ncbi:D-cysteine desulfhydrase family protein [Candidatus Bathyarchaeota archaeon]|nr:D-cysteine desulfhydrase family protein [Candidatus Bathyarchaeota archaeon]
MKFGSLPRVRLANLPTPIQEMPNLTKLLDGAKLWVKRDDLTGLALGGNKARKLEYLMGDVLDKDCNYVVTHAGFHSNWCTQTAAACRKLGLGIVLVKTAPHDNWEPENWDANHLLHKLMGAEIEVTKPDNLRTKLDAQMERLRKEGYRPYYMPVGGSVALGAMGYVNAILEIINQSQEMEVPFDYIVHCTGSGGTQAGLVMGVKAFNSEIKIISVADDSSPPEEHIAKALPIIKEAENILGFNIKVTNEDLTVLNDFGGGGYGFISEEKINAVKILAETEGIFIDPVYTAPAVAQMIDLVKKKKFRKDSNVLFLHTGGTAALFSYKDPFKANIIGEKLPWTIPPWSPKSG